VHEERDAAAAGARDALHAQHDAVSRRDAVQLERVAWCVCVCVCVRVCVYAVSVALVYVGALSLSA
jgi:hypothetical protein